MIIIFSSSRAIYQCTPDPLWYLPATHHVQLASATRPIPVWYLPGLHHVQLPSSVRPGPLLIRSLVRTTWVGWTLHITMRGLGIDLNVRVDYRVETGSVIVWVPVSITEHGIYLLNPANSTCESHRCPQTVLDKRADETGICTPDPVWYLPATHHVQLASAIRPIPVWYLPATHHVQLPSSARPVQCWIHSFSHENM
jgi:hypothetical protein